MMVKRKQYLTEPIFSLMNEPKLFEDTVQNIAKMETKEVPLILTSELEREP